jgi:hypothetical protein
MKTSFSCKSERCRDGKCLRRFDGSTVIAIYSLFVRQSLQYLNAQSSGGDPMNATGRCFMKAEKNDDSHRA